jgi:Na+-translocating ferredoxin:NAD+ oxidoreductase RNF subunit RnfB
MPPNGATTKIYGGNARVLIGAIGLLALGFAVMIIVRTLHYVDIAGTLVISRRVFVGVFMREKHCAGSDSYTTCIKAIELVIDGKNMPSYLGTICAGGSICIRCHNMFADR